MAQEIFEKVTQEEILREQAIARDKYLRDQLHFKNKCKKLEEDTIRLKEQKAQVEEQKAQVEEQKAQVEEEQARVQAQKALIRERIVKIVKLFKASGMPDESIATELGLSIEEVKTIISTE